MSTQQPDEVKLSNTIQTLSVEQVSREEATGSDGNYPESRVISPISPVVVRQDNPEGPKYQEAIGYTFLINSPKYPSVIRMDNGKLVLTLSGALKSGSVEDETKRDEFILFSEDEGMSWSQPRRIAIYRRTTVNLGGTRLMLRGYLGPRDDIDPQVLCFSDDAGQT